MTIAFRKRELPGSRDPQKIRADRPQYNDVARLSELSSLLNHRHLGGVVHARSRAGVVISVRGIDDDLTILFNCFLDFD